MKNIKAAQVITTMEPGGAQASTINLARAVSDHGYESHLVCGREGMLEPEQIKDIRVHRCSLVRSINPVKDIAALFALTRLFRKEKFDIVHTHSSKAGIIGRLAARLAGTKTIVHTVHGFAFHPYQNPIARFVYTLTERIAARFTDKLVCVCKSDINKGLNHGVGRKEQYELIRDFFNPFKPNTFNYTKDKHRQLPDIPKDKKIITMCACLKPQKNPLAFVRAARIIKDICPDVFFVLAGDGILKEKIEDLIKKLSLEESFLVPGWVDDIDSLLRQSNVFVLTSFHEGLPMALLEAMAKGIPAVASRIDGIKEVITHEKNGLLVEPNDLDSFATAVIGILKDEIRLDTTDKTLMNEFTDGRNLTQIDKLYRQLIN